MSTSQHTYGPTCRLSPPSSLAGNATAETPPPLRGQFFYSSATPIDDPLSPLPSVSSVGGASLPRHPSRPFSGYDNAALEEAWQNLECNQRKVTGGGHKTPNAILREGNEGGEESSREQPTAVQDNEVEVKASRNAQMVHSSFASKPSSTDGQLRQSSRSHSKNGSSRTRTLQTSSSKGKDSSSPYGTSPGSDVTGTPFLRAPSRTGRERISISTTDDTNDEAVDHEPVERLTSRTASPRLDPDSQNNNQTNPEAFDERPPSSTDYENQTVSVPVGISRLHVVELPELQMKPIYWKISPAQDIAPVIRGTWFYVETMLPVEAVIANQLETGYSELKPWSENWRDELNSAIAVGAEGEAKVTHTLWPQLEDKRPDTGTRVRTAKPIGIEDDTSTSNIGQPLARGDNPPALRSTDGTNNKAAEPSASTSAEAPQLYSRSSVIYANATEAFILRPGLLPSAYYGRRPLSKIRKGVAVGIPVLRGFDWRAWEKLHPSRRTRVVAETEEIATLSQSGAATLRNRRHCIACQAREKRPQVTDLVFIVHGIGQKYSERDASFHFTHSINNFRRYVHMELGNDAVRQHLRKNFGGIMVLPVNWRSTVSFEDGARPKRSQQDNEFGLRDITPPTLPTVRNLVSDVMLDIPYYLSDHRPIMIQAVIREANRIFRLWCKNNPGFQERGHCHLIAHSLGSAMALDILSEQPTELPKEIDLTSMPINVRHLDFDVKNLFFCGSPAGFFLLLNRSRTTFLSNISTASSLPYTGTLLPRKGRQKADAQDEDLGTGIAGEAGTYGCLAVDNLYNVVNFNDRKILIQASGQLSLTDHVPPVSQLLAISSAPPSTPPTPRL